MSPVLFIDFDGVLNGDTFLRFQKHHVPREEHRLFLDWLAKHSPSWYLVLDDFDLSEVLGETFFRTDESTGLMLQLVEEIIAAFRRSVRAQVSPHVPGP